jgi:hypothetical protein
VVIWLDRLAGRVVTSGLAHRESEAIGACSQIELREQQGYLEIQSELFNLISELPIHHPFA